MKELELAKDPVQFTWGKPTKEYSGQEKGELPYHMTFHSSMLASSFYGEDMREMPFSPLAYYAQLETQLVASIWLYGETFWGKQFLKGADFLFCAGRLGIMMEMALSRWLVAVSSCLSLPDFDFARHFGLRNRSSARLYRFLLPYKCMAPIRFVRGQFSLKWSLLERPTFVCESLSIPTMYFR